MNNILQLKLLIKISKECIVPFDNKIYTKLIKLLIINNISTNNHYTYIKLWIIPMKDKNNTYIILS